MSDAPHSSLLTPPFHHQRQPLQQLPQLPPFARRESRKHLTLEGHVLAEGPGTQVRPRSVNSTSRLRGPVPHRHPYDEVAFVRSGRGRWTVDGVEWEAGPGDILVVKAGEVHSFVNIGEEPLIQVDIHLGPHFLQEDLPDALVR